MTKNENKDRFSVGEVSKQYNISIKTLRYYDEIGLLKPRERNDQNGYRYYTNEDIGTLLTIKYYQETGLSLETIKSFLETKELSAIISLFENTIEDQSKEIQRLTIGRDSLIAWKNLVVEGEMLRKEKNIPFSIKKTDAINTLSEGYRINDAHTIKRISLKQKSSDTKQVCIGAVFRELESVEKLLTQEPQFCFNHMEIHPLSFRGIGHSKLGGNIVLSGIHKGSTDTILTTYKAMLKYAKEEELPLKGNAIERYIIDASTVADPQYLITEIMLPLA